MQEKFNKWAKLRQNIHAQYLKELKSAEHQFALENDLVSYGDIVEDDRGKIKITDKHFLSASSKGCPTMSYRGIKINKNGKLHASGAKRVIHSPMRINKTLYKVFYNDLWYFIPEKMYNDCQREGEAVMSQILKLEHKYYTSGDGNLPVMLDSPMIVAIVHDTSNHKMNFEPYTPKEEFKDIEPKELIGFTEDEIKKILEEQYLERAVVSSENPSNILLVPHEEIEPITMEMPLGVSHGVDKFGDEPILSK